MKLYHFPPSPNSVKVLALINHLRLNVDIEIVDLTKGESSTPEFKAINPNGKIPTLVDDDFTIWESQAIMRYLAEKHKSDLIPSDLQERAKMDQWLSWHLAHFGPALAAITWERLAPQFFEGYQTDEHALNKGLTNLARFAPVLDEHLASREYLVGNRLTLADLALASALIHREAAQIPVTQYKNLMEWYGRVLALPYFQAALPPAPVNA